MPTSLRRMLPRHFKMVELFLEGLTNKQVAERLGMSPAAISTTFRSPVFQSELARRRGDIEEVSNNALAVSLVNAKASLESAAEKAANVHVGLLDDENARVRQLSANEILDRVGLGKSTAPQGEQGVVVLDVETLNVLQVALKESDDYDGG